LFQSQYPPTASIRYCTDNAAAQDDDHDDDDDHRRVVFLLRVGVGPD